VFLNSSAITIAILGLLQGDAALQAILPDGAWFAIAPEGCKAFVIVQLVSGVNVPMFGGPAYKDATYLIEARVLSTEPGDVNAAYDRIVALLTDGDLPLSGYAKMLVQFEDDIEMVEVDAVDASIRWNRCGGHCHVMVTTSSAGVTR
jgi:hypothetical protein